MISKLCHRNCSEFEAERKKLKRASEVDRPVILDRMYALDQRFQAMPLEERLEALNFYYPRRKIEVQETIGF